MFNHPQRTLTHLIVAAVVLSACGPTTGAPTITSATQPSANTPLSTTPPPAVTSPTEPLAPAATSLSYKSKDPTTLTYLTLPGDPATMDPAFDYETAGSDVIQNVYDTLIFYNRSQADQFVPQLATEVPSQANGGISADGKTYTFKIRAGVKFHNGDPLMSGDVAFSFQRGLLQGGLSSPQWLLFQPILGLAASPSGNNDITDLVDPSGKLGDDKKDLLQADPAKLLAACQAVTSAIVADDAAGTVTFHLPQPWGPFLATLAGTWGSISDKKWFSANGGWDGNCHTWQNFYQTQSADINQFKLGTGENGTGPYVLDHWTLGQEIVLKSFDGYWRTTPAWPGGPTGAPRLKTIVIKLNVAKFSQRLTALQAGDADVVDIDQFSDWSKEDPFVGETCDAAGACQAAANPNNPLRVFKGLPANNRHDVFFNFQINTTGGNDFIGSGKLDGDGIPPDFFNDIHVRRAFNYCFDWSAYLKAPPLSDGGVQAFDVMLPGEIGYSPNDRHYVFDAAKCRAEFQTSTLKSATGDSLWDTGFRFSIVYNADSKNADIFHEAAAQILSQNLKAVNPKFVVQAVDLPFKTYVAAYTARATPVFILGWQEDIHDPHNWLVPYITGIYAVKQSLPPDLAQPLADLMNQGVAETDPARRAAIYQQFNQAFYAAAPDILLTQWETRQYTPRWVQGYYYNPIYSGFYFYALSKL